MRILNSITIDAAGNYFWFILAEVKQEYQRCSFVYYGKTWLSKYTKVIQQAWLPLNYHVLLNSR